MSTSQKHRSFVDEPMGDKPVNVLPGIGDVLEKRLKAKGYVRAKQVLGKYLEMKQDADKFIVWLQQTFKAQYAHAHACQAGLQEYCNHNL